MAGLNGRTGRRVGDLAVEVRLQLSDAHWELIRFLRQYYAEHGVQAQVRVMIRHFSKAWGPDRGSNHHLHEMFPRGGPQKQGNRLAGLLRTKGEHGDPIVEADVKTRVRNLCERFPIYPEL